MLTQAREGRPPISPSLGPPGTPQLRPTPAEDRQALLAKSIMDEVDLIGRDRRLSGYRVAYKQNVNGEHVVAIIWPIPSPSTT